MVCLLVRVLSILTFFISLSAFMSRMLAVLKYLACLLAYVLGVLVCNFSFTFEKLNSKNSYIGKSVFIQIISRNHLNTYDGVFLRKKLTAQSF